ncbi:MAG TPA: DUF4347 domain-containing protein, partial [Polyangiaceae bacterium]
MSAGLRLILYDRTCVNRAGLGLTRAWSAGSVLYSVLRRSDGAHGAQNWEEGLEWLSSFRADQPIDEVQYWGHGKWGRLLLAGASLDAGALLASHRYHRALRDIRERLSDRARIWFRTCETFGAAQGHDFAHRCTDFFGRPAAGHTFIIGYWQSGLHLLEPGNAPTWAPTEG